MRRRALAATLAVLATAEAVLAAATRRVERWATPTR
jgi:hypothetical protein